MGCVICVSLVNCVVHSEFVRNQDSSARGGWGKRRAAQYSRYIESRPHATELCHPAATVLFSFFDRDDLAADTSASLAASWASAHTRPRPSV